MQITQKKVKAIFAVNWVILCSKSKFKLLYLKIWAYILSNFFLRWFWICYNHLNQKKFPLRSAPSAFLLSQKKPKMPFFMKILDIWFLCGKEYKSKKKKIFYFKNIFNIHVTSKFKKISIGTKINDKIRVVKSQFCTFH